MSTMLVKKKLQAQFGSKDCKLAEFGLMSKLSICLSSLWKFKVRLENSSILCTYSMVDGFWFISNYQCRFGLRSIWVMGWVKVGLDYKIQNSTTQTKPSQGRVFSQQGDRFFSYSKFLLLNLYWPWWYLCCEFGWNKFISLQF